MREQRVYVIPCTWTVLYVSCHICYMYCRLQLEWKYVTTHEKRDLPPHLVGLYNKPKCSKNWSQVKIQITLVLWTTILCLPCGEVSTVMRTLVCPGEVFPFHDCELFEAVIHCVQRRCGHVMSTVAMATGTTASRILEKTILSKSFIKQSYNLECMFLSLGWHWKGAKKRKKPERSYWQAVGMAIHPWLHA